MVGTNFFFCQSFPGNDHIAEEFAKGAHPDFRESVKSAPQRALEEAELAAKHYGITNPL